MSYQVQFEENALLQFSEVYHYYNKISEKLALEFYEIFWLKIDYLKIYPKHHQIRYKRVRIAFIYTYPIGIHFIIEGQVLSVISILHNKQMYS